MTPLAEGDVDGLQGSLLQIDISEIIVHEADGVGDAPVTVSDDQPVPVELDFIDQKAQVIVRMESFPRNLPRQR